MIDTKNNIVYVEGNIIISTDLEIDVVALNGEDDTELRVTANDIIYGDLLIKNEPSQETRFVAKKDVIYDESYQLCAKDCYDTLSKNISILKSMLQKFEEYESVSVSNQKLLKPFYGEMTYMHLFVLYEKFVIDMILMLYGKYPKMIADSFSVSGPIDNNSYVPLEVEKRILEKITTFKTGTGGNLVKWFNTNLGIELEYPLEEWYDIRNKIAHRGSRDKNADVRMLTTDKIKSALDCIMGFSKLICEQVETYEQNNQSTRLIQIL